MARSAGDLAQQAQVHETGNRPQPIDLIENELGLSPQRRSLGTTSDSCEVPQGVASKKWRRTSSGLRNQVVVTVRSGS